MNFLLIFVFALFLSGSESVEIECEYSKNKNYEYFCDVQKWTLPITSKSDLTISDIRGKHFDGYTNDDIKPFHSISKIVKYFPRGLTEFFKNIELVKIVNAQLKEITKEDLKQFGDKLKYLELHHNDIEIIEGDLFEFNKNLKYIDLEYNKITRIEAGAFNGLEGIGTLTLRFNKCTSDGDYEYSNPSNVLSLIHDVKAKCKPLQYLAD